MFEQNPLERKKELKGMFVLIAVCLLIFALALGTLFTLNNPARYEVVKSLIGRNGVVMFAVIFALLVIGLGFGSFISLYRTISWNIQYRIKIVLVILLASAIIIFIASLLSGLLIF